MGEQPTILFVDDEPAIADGHAARLSNDYETRAAHDGETALERLDGVDVVVLDRRMPGLSGDEVLAEIRDADEDCRVVMATGVEPDEDVVEMGFDDYLVKPIARDELEETIERLLAETAYGLESEVLDALGDLKTRHCWRVLTGRACSAHELAEVTGYSLTTVYRRLNTLQRAGLIEAREVVDPDGDHYRAFESPVREVRVSLVDGLAVEVAAPDGDGQEDADEHEAASGRPRVGEPPAR